MKKFKGLDPYLVYKVIGTITFITVLACTVITMTAATAVAKGV